MTQELSIWALILGATLPVKLVMLILFGASMVSWVMIVQRGLFLRRAGTDLKHFEGTFWSGIDLNQLFNDGNLRLQSNRPVPGVEAVFRAGFREFNRLGQQTGAEPDAVIAGVERAMRVALSREEESSIPIWRFWPASPRSAPTSACSAPCGASCRHFAAWPGCSRRRWRWLHRASRKR